MCLTRHDHPPGHDGGSKGGEHGSGGLPQQPHPHSMAFFHPTQQQPPAGGAPLALPQMSAPSQMPRVQARPREEILGGGFVAAGGGPPAQHIHPHQHEDKDGDYSPLSPPRRRVVPRTYLNGGGGNGGNGAGQQGPNNNQLGDAVVAVVTEGSGENNTAAPEPRRAADSSAGAGA